MRLQQSHLISQSYSLVCVKVLLCVTIPSQELRKETLSTETQKGNITLKRLTLEETLLIYITQTAEASYKPHLNFRIHFLHRKRTRLCLTSLRPCWDRQQNWVKEKTINWNGTSALPQHGWQHSHLAEKVIPSSTFATKEFSIIEEEVGQSNTCKCTFLVEYFVTWTLYFYCLTQQTSTNKIYNDGHCDKYLELQNPVSRYQKNRCAGV